MRKAFEKHEQILTENKPEDLWEDLMLLPYDYSQSAIFNETTREIMKKVELQHGGDEYDQLYPEGIPTSISVITKDDK